MTQAQALSIIKMGKNVYLTGAAGSGKTHTLHAYIAYLKKKNIEVAVTASTGIAATHLGGMTIHSWSGLGVRDHLSEWDIDALESRQNLWRRYQATKVLIIDEISMLHHFRFDLLDRLCRSFKRNEAAFGGLQIILSGDFFQLPPVSRSGEPRPEFAYKSKIWQEMDLTVCYLSEQHRQSDSAFLSVLSAIREDNVGEETMEHLRGRYRKKPDSDLPPTKLFSHNADIEVINNTELSKIPGEERTFQMVFRGRKPLAEILAKSCLAPEKLVLKIGARVMFVKNNYEKGFINGTLGEVTGYDQANNPLVRVSTGKILTASLESWRIEEEGKVKAEIIQVPLRLAWAITIHKSQGMSLEAAEIDLSKSFVAGMGYVALSRVRSLEGLSLLGLNDVALKINSEVFEVDQKLRRQSEEAEKELEKLSPKTIQDIQREFVHQNASTKTKGSEHISTEHKTRLLVLEKMPLEKIASERGLKEGTILEHLETLLEENGQIDIGYIKEARLNPTRFKKIETAFKKSFEKNGDTRLAPVKIILGASFSYEELRLARLFINLG